VAVPLLCRRYRLIPKFVLCLVLRYEVVALPNGGWKYQLILRLFEVLFQGSV